METDRHGRKENRKESSSVSPSNVPRLCLCHTDFFSRKMWLLSLRVPLITCFLVLFCFTYRLCTQLYILFSFTFSSGHSNEIALSFLFVFLFFCSFLYNDYGLETEKKWENLITKSWRKQIKEEAGLRRRCIMLKEAPQEIDLTHPW